MADEMRPLAVVTGASTGIGFELAKQCAHNGFDLLIAADEPAVHEAAEILKRHDIAVEAVEADLATTHGVDRLYETAKAQGRPIEALMANAGRGLGHGFLDQDFNEAMRVVNTNITGTLYLLHRFGRDMREQGFGKILITGATETPFFERAGMLDTKVGTQEKDNPADVAKEGFKAMMQGEGGIIYG